MPKRSRTAERYGTSSSRYSPLEEPSLATKIGKRITPQPDGCWHYDGYHNPAGYAMYSSTLVHRLLYEIIKGDQLPSDMHVHHLCEVKRCVNPAHLVAVPQSTHTRVHSKVRAERKAG